jgi:hypothetical protein
MLMMKTRRLIPTTALTFLAATLAFLSAAAPAGAQSGDYTYHGMSSVTVSEGPSTLFTASDVPATITFVPEPFGGTWMYINPDVSIPGQAFAFMESMPDDFDGSGSDYTFAGGRGGFSAYYDIIGTDIVAEITRNYSGGIPGPDLMTFDVTFQGSTIPEPSSIVTLATGIAGLAVAGAYQRQRLRRKAAVSASTLA